METCGFVCKKPCWEVACQEALNMSQQKFNFQLVGGLLQNVLTKIQARQNVGDLTLVMTCALCFAAGARSDAGTSSAADASALGKAPPCENFLDLLTFQELEEAHQKFYNCGSRNEIAEMHESMTKAKNAIKDLIVGHLDKKHLWTSESQVVQKLLSKRGLLQAFAIFTLEVKA